MAKAKLFKCPDCKAKISTSAEACPKCGRPIKPEDLPKEEKTPLWVQIASGIIVVLLFAWFSGGDDDKKEDEAEPVKQEAKVEKKAYTPVKVTFEELSPLIVEKFDGVVRKEIERITKKAGGKAPTRYTLTWQEVQPSYELWLIVEGDRRMNQRAAERAGTMLVGHIHAALTGLGVTSEQFKKDDAYISVYVMHQRDIGKFSAYGADIWHVGKEGELPFWEVDLVRRDFPW